MDARGDRRVQVAFYGEFGTGNLGNDASLVAAVTALKTHFHNVNCIVLCNDPEAVAHRFGLRALSITRHGKAASVRKSSAFAKARRRAMILLRLCSADLVRMFRIMRGVDVVIVPGMGVMEAGWMKPGSFPAPLLMTVLAARFARVRFAFVSIGADAAHRRSTRALFRWALRLASYRSYRDVHSRDSAIGFGAPARSDPVYPDLVFGYESLPGRTADTKPTTVGIGLIKYRATFSDDEPARRDAVDAMYNDAVKEIVGWLLDRGCRVILMTGDRKDEEVSASIRNAMAARRDPTSLELAQSDSFDDLLSHVGKVDLMIASRYHNIIAATLTATPAISISYLPKNDVLWDEIGLDGFHQPLEQLDLAQLRTQFLELQREASTVSKKMTAKSREYADLVQQQWSLLTRTVLSKTR